MNLENFVPGLTKFAFLLANQNLDFAIENSIFCFIKDQTNLRLQSERSTSECGSFRLVSQSGFRSLLHLMKPLFDRKKCSFISKHGGSRLVQAKVIYIPPLLYAAKFHRHSKSVRK